MTSSALAPASRRIAATSSRSDCAEAGVERGERLVEQHDLRLRRERPGQRDALALAARQLVRVGRRPVGQADQLQALLDPAGAASPKPTLRADGEVREQRAVLEDHADAPALGLYPDAVARDGAAADGDRAGVGDLEAGDDAQQRGLARSARSEQRDQLTVRTRGDAPATARVSPNACVDVDGVDRGRARHGRRYRRACS